MAKDTAAPDLPTIDSSFADDLNTGAKVALKKLMHFLDYEGSDKRQYDKAKVGVGLVRANVSLISAINNREALKQAIIKAVK